MWTHQDILYRDQHNKQRKMLHMNLNIRDMAKFAEPTQGWEQAVLPGWNDSTSTSKYIPRTITSRRIAQEAIAEFSFPKDIRQRANKAARKLTDVFMEVAAKVLEPDHVSGRFDMRKASRVVEAIYAGDYDPRRIRPAKRWAMQEHQRPTIAIVAEAANTSMWHDKTFIPRMFELALSVGWAAEAADFDVWASMVQGLWDARHLSEGYDHILNTTNFLEPDRSIGLKDYAPTFHRDMWRWGWMNAHAVDPRTFQKSCAIQGLHAQRRFNHRNGSIGLSFSCEDGGYAVTWARAQGADIVISIGNILDARDSDIHIPDSKINLEAAVNLIAQQAKQLK